MAQNREQSRDIIFMLYSMHITSDGLFVYLPRMCEDIQEQKHLTALGVKNNSPINSHALCIISMHAFMLLSLTGLLHIYCRYLSRDLLGNSDLFFGFLSSGRICQKYA